MMPRLTDDAKLRRRSQRKADAINAKLVASAGPLYADQIPADEFTSAEREYWRTRRMDMEGGRGQGAADLGGADWRWDLFVLRCVARRHMSPADFAIADAASDKHGERQHFWMNLLCYGQRIVLSYWRHVYGCMSVRLERWPAPHWTAALDGEHGELVHCVEKRVEVGEALVWPPAGWTPPLTRAQLDALLSIPPPADFAGAVDPWNLSPLENR
jgi:hypothetical protein